MKRTYIHPKMIAVKLQNQSHLMEDSTFSGLGTNQTYADGDYIGFTGTNTTYEARVKESNLWDDVW
jgi:hypothetical protein